ncbi:CAP domain-containing protein [Candidatus Woesearchaeota archaeon]|nr:CAP domain-containing protein [Candidatus Woesearchaeota archaeon]
MVLLLAIVFWQLNVIMEMRLSDAIPHAPTPLVQPPEERTQVTTDQGFIEKFIKESEQSERDRPSLDIDELELHVHDLTNVERAQNGLDRLEYDDALAAVARAHSEDMASRGFFDHTNPDGESPSDRAERQGYKCRKVGILYITEGIAENLAKLSVYESKTSLKYQGKTYYVYEWYSQDELAEKTVDGWMDSPGHRENILTEGYDAEGIGVAVSDELVYVTQDFC